MTNSSFSPITTESSMANSTFSLFTTELSMSDSSVPSDDKHENEFMSFWLDGVFKILVGCFGIFINSLAIWILVTQQKMQNMFLHILTCSLFFDNGYMLMEVLTTLYWDFNVKGLVWLLPYVAYPFKEVFYTCNILITISLSYERYALISDSKGYKQTMEISKFRHKRLKKYLLAIIMFSIMFNLPSFFTHSVSMEKQVIDKTGEMCTLKTLEDYKPVKTCAYTIHRAIWKILDKAVKWTIFLIGSFSLLVFFNWKLFKSVKEKLQVREEIRKISSISVPESGGLHKTKKDTTIDKVRSRIKILKTLRKREKFTTALFALVTSFFICNVWFLGEAIADGVRLKGDAKSIFENYEIISRLMRMLNSCTNVFIYCVVDRTFKNFFKQDLKSIAYYMSCTLLKNLKPTAVREEESNFRSHSESQPLSKRTTTADQRISSTKSTTLN